MKYPKSYSVFRIVVGLLFATIGAGKLFGILGGTAVEMFSLLWFAGIIEFVGGLMVAAGLWTQFAAGLCALLMLIAYFKVHAGLGANFNPLVNQGERAILYFVSFMLIASIGAHRWTLKKFLYK